jgi:TolB-like protein/Tfp pilus assembly protein PilF/DNA-binding winged helix-turn-helix (wHTH) protein
MAPGMENNESAATAPQPTGYQVDDLVIDLGQRRVTRGGNDIPMPHLSFQLLVTLARSAPDVVTFDQLTERVWPGLVITPETISQRVKLVRDALGDEPHAPRYIAGVRGSGYRMVATVRPLKDRRRPAPGQELPYWIKSEGVAEAGDATATATPPARAPAAAESPTAGSTVAPPRAFAWLGAFLVIALLLAAPWAITHYLRAPKVTQETASGPGVVIVQPARTIAVLPLIDMSPDRSNAYLGDGLAQELSARLARLPGVRVAASTSAFAFRGRTTDARTIAQTLGVRHILEGSVHREGDRLRVTAQLIDGTSGYDVWSQTYNRTWRDLMAIEDDLARSIISSLRLVLSNDLALRAAQPPTTHPSAFDLYLAGLAKLHGPGTTSLDEAGESFRRALAEDPKFPLAYAGLCERYALGYDKTRDAALIPQAESACGEALRLDPSLREVSAALGQLYLVSGRYQQATARYRDAISSDPENADGYVGLGEALDAQHRTADAERAFRKAVNVEPTYWGAQNALGNFLFRHGRTTAATATYRRVTELIPASPLAFNNLGAALLVAGDFQGAAGAFDRSLALEPTSSAYSNSGTVYYFLGRYPDAARMFTHATELTAQDHRVWGNLGDALWQIEGSRTEAQNAYRRAIGLARKGLEVNAQDGVSWSQLAYYSARAHDDSDVRGYTGRALQLNPDDPTVRYYTALTALALGDPAAALESLSRAVALGYPAPLVRAAPDFNSLHSDARFQHLLAQAQESQPGSLR